MRMQLARALSGCASKPSALQKRRCRALTRRDVVVAILGVCFLVMLWGKLLGGNELRKTWVCKHRLRVLSDAFAQYTSDNGRALPPALLETSGTTTTWDRIIAPYIVRVGKGEPLPSQAKIGEEAAQAFHCPSDTEPRGGAKPRSYSMPVYDVKKEGWPPVPSSQGGLGLYLDVERFKLAREATPTAPQGSIPAIRLTMVPDAAWTALLVERPAIRNVLWAQEYAVTASPREQWTAKTIALEKFHRSRLNYLMLDGHVERMTIRQSAGHAGNGGVWTIRPWD